MSSKRKSHPMKILSDHQLFPSRKVINTLVQKRLFGFCAAAVIVTKKSWFWYGFLFWWGSRSYSNLYRCNDEITMANNVRKISIPLFCGNLYLLGFDPIHTAKTQYRKFETNIPRKGIVRPQSQFPHSCVCERCVWGRAISFLGIHKWDLRCSALAFMWILTNSYAFIWI
jgi:hypothetical protein